MRVPTATVVLVEICPPLRVGAARGKGRHAPAERFRDLMLEALSAEGPAAICRGAQSVDEILLQHLFEQIAVRLLPFCRRAAEPAENRRLECEQILHSLSAPR